MFATDDPSTVAYGQPLFLQAEESTFVDPVTNPAGNNTGTKDGGFMSEVDNNNNAPTTTPTRPATNPGTMMGLAGEEYTANGTSAKDNLAYTSRAKRYQGRYFRIQIGALKTYDSGNSRFSTLSNYGEVATEYIPSRNLTRVLVGDYFSQSEVTFALDQIKSEYPNAYVVQYDDGVRYGRVNL